MMFHHPRIAEMLFNTPLMVLPAKGEVIVDVFRKYSEMATPSDAPTPPAVEETVPREEMLGIVAERTNAGYMRTADGVAIIPVLGSLVHRGGFLDSMSGLTSYTRLANQLSAAMTDPRTKAIVFEIDSPGGSASGIFELSAMINAASAQKPVMSVANEQAFSGGYMLLAAAGQAFMAEPGMVGSVGVVMYHIDQSKALEKRGLVITPIYAGDRKIDFSSHAPLGETAMAWAQDSVNRTYDRFAGAVAQYRAISVDAVKETKAGLLHSDQALAIKFVDGVASLKEVMSRALEKTKSQYTLGFTNGVSAAATNAHNLKEQQMDTKETAAPTGAAQTAVTADQLAAATEQGRQLGLKEGMQAGMTAERKRIGEILNAPESQGKQALARHLATGTDMTAEQAVATLKVSPAEPQSQAASNEFAKAMGQTGNPNVGATGNSTTTGERGSEKSASTIDANGIFEKRRAAAEQARSKG